MITQVFLRAMVAPGTRTFMCPPRHRAMWLNFLAQGKPLAGARIELGTFRLQRPWVSQDSHCASKTPMIIFNLTIFSNISTCYQARVQEFVRGGAQNLKAFFFAFQFFRGGAAQKIAEKMIFSTNKVAKYRWNSLTFAFFLLSIFQGGGGSSENSWENDRLARASSTWNLVVFIFNNWVEFLDTMKTNYKFESMRISPEVFSNDTH